MNDIHEMTYLDDYGNPISLLDLVQSNPVWAARKIMESESMNEVAERVVGELRKEISAQRDKAAIWRNEVVLMAGRLRKAQERTT